MSNRYSLGIIVVLSFIAGIFATLWYVQGNSLDTEKKVLGEEQVKKIVEKFIQERSEVVYTAAVQGRQKQRELEVQRLSKTIGDKKQELENDPGSPSFSTPGSDVTLIVFSDYNCGYCQRIAPVLESLLAKDRKIRYVSKDFPILGQNSHIAAIAGLAIYKMDKEKYLPFHFGLLKSSARSLEQIFAIARNLGIDVEKLTQEMANPRYQEQVRANLALGQGIGVNGTPAMVLNGELIPGALGLEELEKRIADARARKG